MNQAITIRLTPTRERLLKLFKKRFNIKKNSEAIELALRMSFNNEISYESKIKKVAGCIESESHTDAVSQIRSLRDIE